MVAGRGVPSFACPRIPDGKRGALRLLLHAQLSNEEWNRRHAGPQAHLLPLAGPPLVTRRDCAAIPTSSSVLEEVQTQARAPRSPNLATLAVAAFELEPRRLPCAH